MKEHSQILQLTSTQKQKMVVKYLAHTLSLGDP